MATPEDRITAPGALTALGGLEARRVSRRVSRAARRRALLPLLLVFALIGLTAIGVVTRALMNTPSIDARWQVDDQDHVRLASSDDPALQAHAGQLLVSITPLLPTGGAQAGPPQAPRAVPVDAIALLRSARWVINDRDRGRQMAAQASLNAVLEAPAVRLGFGDGSQIELRAAPRAFGSLPGAFWLLCAVCLALFLTPLNIALDRSSARNLLYTLMAWCQAGNLLLIAAQMSLTFGLQGNLARWGLPMHVAFDLITAAAMVTAATLHPAPLRGGRWVTLAAWASALVVTVLVAADALPGLWWWTQGLVLLLGFAVIGLFSVSYRLVPHPLAIVLRQLALITASTWGLMTFALAGSDGLHGVPHHISDSVAVVWYVYLAAVLLLVPFLAQAQNLMREFALLAAVSSIAISLYLLFVGVFAFGQLPSLTLALFVSLAVYSIVRQWILAQLIGSSVLTTERVFEQLYRIAREIESQPERAPALMSQLLRDVFEPLEIALSDRVLPATRLAGDAASMLVPLPELGAEDPGGTRSVRIRFAQRGRRLFNAEDVRLTDRLVEQLRRVVQFDKAVEQGRREERLRLAQDLHDDIGARLLTLMYTAKSPEMEDYVRHTLLDLKTLTRGLAASNHRLSHAAAEWKADLAHRLSAAHVELVWRFEADDDILLSVVHWSALTRILRELVSNAIAHAQATRLSIDFRLEHDRLELIITDDGIGSNPREWSHGLGLGGVRKRVKQLGGEVEWREIQPHGIGCRVVIGDVSVRWQT